MLRRSMLEVFSWIETACYGHFSGKKQHVAGIIGGRISCFEAFCRQETTYPSRVLQRRAYGELRRFSRKIRYVETPYWAKVAY